MNESPNPLNFKSTVPTYLLKVFTGAQSFRFAVLVWSAWPQMRIHRDDCRRRKAEIWVCRDFWGLSQVYPHLFSANSLLFLISPRDLITMRSCLFLDLGKGNLVRTKWDGKIQGSSSKWGIAMETNRLGLNWLLWPFSSVIVSSDESGSTMPRSLELSAARSFCCTHHNSRQAVVFAAHLWKTLWWWCELWPKYCYRECCDYCSPLYNPVVSSPRLCLKTSWAFRVNSTFFLHTEASQSGKVMGNREAAMHPVLRPTAYNSRWLLC